MDPDVLNFMGVMGTIAGFIFAMTLVRGLSHRMGAGGRKHGGCSCLEGDHEDLAERAIAWPIWSPARAVWKNWKSGSISPNACWRTPVRTTGWWDRRTHRHLAVR